MTKQIFVDRTGFNNNQKRHNGRQEPIRQEPEWIIRTPKGDHRCFDFKIGGRSWACASYDNPLVFEDKIITLWIETESDIVLDSGLVV